MAKKVKRAKKVKKAAKEKSYPLDMNGLAMAVADEEGKQESLSIAQIKEVLRITARMIAEEKRLMLVLLTYGFDQLLTPPEISYETKKPARRSKKKA